MSQLNKQNLAALLKTSINTINMLSEELSKPDPSDEILCHYCSHFPMGGDGKCNYKTTAKTMTCNFAWRYAETIDTIIKELENENID